MPETLTQIKTVSKLFIGMDLHKNTSTFSVKTLEGKEAVSKKINTDKNEVRKFIETIKKKTDYVSSALELVSQWKNHQTRFQMA